MFSKDNKVSMKRRVFAAAAAMLVTSALVVLLPITISTLLLTCRTS